MSKISSLEDDIACFRSLPSRYVSLPRSPAPRSWASRFPTASAENVNLGDVLPYVKGGPLELAIGRDAEGTPVVADLAKMPHLLIAGTTGSGSR